MRKDLARNFATNEDGGYAIMAGLLLPVLIGTAALASDVGFWAFRHQDMQGAADAAALAGVVRQKSGFSPITEARAVTATSGFQDGVDNVTVQVNSPPASGAYAGTPNYVEVTVQQPHQPMLAKLFSSAAVTISARAVARQKTTGGACVLALSPTAGSKGNEAGVTFGGSATVSLTGCNAQANSSGASAVYAYGSAQVKAGSIVTPGGIIGADGHITTTGGLYPGSAVTPDPYASASYPSYSSSSAVNFPASGEISPGVYKGSIDGAVTLKPGTYYVDAYSFVVNGGGSLQGSGVTLVLVDMFNKINSNSNLNMINGNSPINLTAPTDGPTAGLVVFADRNLKAKINFNGGSSQNWGGAIYMPGVNFTYVGGASGTGCTQVIADQVTFTGVANMALNCAGTAVKPISSQIAELVE